MAIPGPAAETSSRATIVALASGAGRAGVAVLRLSGPQAKSALEALTGRPAPRPRYAALATLRDADAQVLDQALTVWFAAPASFTGEDVVELHTHGGPAVVSAVIATLLARPGVRLAEPGEFTRRAFENGKLDLAQAEGLADLVDAETEGQRRQALRQMQGALSAVYEGWRADLVSAMALLEAEIDFPDEDLPSGLSARVTPILASLAAQMEAHLKTDRGVRVRDGYRVAILGAPNAGKSSLLNALAGRDAAIVSDIPGTTRDVVEVRLVVAGYPVWLADTAGLREAADSIEAEGVRRALARAEDADLRLAAISPDAPETPALAAAMRPDDLWLATKADLAGPDGGGPIRPGALSISTATGAGLDRLWAALERRVASDLSVDEAPALTRERHKRLVTDALAGVRRAMDALDDGPELAAEDLRAAAVALGRLTGRIDVEDLLDEVFAKFCIGK